MRYLAAAPPLGAEVDTVPYLTHSAIACVRSERRTDRQALPPDPPVVGAEDEGGKRLTARQPRKRVSAVWLAERQTDS